MQSGPRNWDQKWKFWKSWSGFSPNYPRNFKLVSFQRKCYKKVILIETPTHKNVFLAFKIAFIRGGQKCNFSKILPSSSPNYPKSFTSSHCKVLNVCREHFPFTSRLAASLYSLCGLITRVVGMIMYFTVPLGLFSLLRHWQGEQTPWSHETLDFVTPEGLMFMGDNEGFVWNEVDRWIKNGTLFFFNEYGALTPNPDYFVAAPDVTLYIGLTWHPYLYIFFAHVAVHSFVIFFAKYNLSQVFRYGFNLLDKFIHSLENTNLPFNCQEWDDGKGDAEEHRKRMRLNWREGLAIIIINAIFNSSLLVPLYYLGIPSDKNNSLRNSNSNLCILFSIQNARTA